MKNSFVGSAYLFYKFLIRSSKIITTAMIIENIKNRVIYGFHFMKTPPKYIIYTIYYMLLTSTVF